MINTVGVLFKKDLMEQMRSRKVLILAIVFIFLALVSPISAKLMPQLLKNFAAQDGVTITIPDPTFIDAIAQFIKNTGQLIVFLLIFVVAGAVVDEKVRKTLEMVLVKPVSRSSFVISKFLAYFSSITLFYLASVLIFYTYTVSIFESFSFLNFFTVSILTLVYVLLILSVTIFASTLVKSAAMAGVIGLFSSFVFGSILGLFSWAADYSPGYILSYYPDLMLRGWDAKFLPPTILSVALIILLMAASVFFFKEQEIER